MSDRRKQERRLGGKVRPFLERRKLLRRVEIRRSGEERRHEE